MSVCFHVSDAHCNHVSVNFHFQSFLKEKDLKLFSIKNSKSQALVNSVFVYEFQPKKLAEQQ